MVVIDYQPSNREKRQEPRGHSSWCHACDRAVVSEGAKCPYCRKRAGQRRFKFGKTPL